MGDLFMCGILGHLIRFHTNEPLIVEKWRMVEFKISLIGAKVVRERFSRHCLQFVIM